MPGERVLVVDNSATVQEICKGILEDNGYRVTIASNGLAAVVHPEVEQYDLILVDSSLEGISGLETTRQIKTDKETYKIPVLLMIPEDSIDLLESVPLKGATGWISKPFTPKKLLIKVNEIIEEQRLLQLSQEYLKDSAERHMQTLAEQKIQTAVEKKIQIIVERAIQSIVSIIDQRARREVEARVTALTAEKEQELVKLTVQEVAKSMVEKLAERKVSEAIAGVLVEQTEKTVKRAVDGMLPGLIRERLREQIEGTLPREIESRVNKAAEERAVEIGEGIVQIVQSQAQKLVPVVAREAMPDLAERQIAIVAEGRLPKLISDAAHAAMSQEMNGTVTPFVDSELHRVRKRMNYLFVFATLILILATVLLAILLYFSNEKLIDSIIENRIDDAFPTTPKPKTVEEPTSAVFDGESWNLASVPRATLDVVSVD